MNLLNYLNVDYKSDTISLHLNWDIETLRELKTILNWDEISSSTKIVFDYKILFEFRNELNWDSISRNKSIKWTLSLIENFKNYLNWEVFCEYFRIYNLSNYYFEDDEFINIYYDFCYFFNTYINWTSFSKNKNIDWHMIAKISISNTLSCVGEENILEFPVGYNRPNNKTLMTCFKEYWDFNEILSNDKIDKLHWIELINDFEKLSATENLKVNKFLIEKYEDKWDFKALTKNGSIEWSCLYTQWSDDLLWTTGLLDKYKEKWDWQYLSSKENPQIDVNVKNIFCWSKSLLLKYVDKWDWERIVYNKSIKWTEEMFEELACYIPESLWKGRLSGRTGYYYYTASAMSHASHIPLSSNVLKKYATSWREGYIDGCERSTDDPGDWIVYLTCHNITLSAFKEYNLEFQSFIVNKSIESLKELQFYCGLCNNDEDYSYLLELKGVKNLLDIEKLKNLNF